MDLEILIFIRNHLTNPIFDAIAKGFNPFMVITILYVAIAIMMLISKRYRRYGILLLIILALQSLIVSGIIKPFVARPRPFLTYPVDLIVKAPSEYSFPSGHATCVFAAAMLIYFANHKWGIFAFILALIIALSRLYLFVHYPSDVLAGAILGSLVALLVIRIAQHYKFIE